SGQVCIDNVVPVVLGKVDRGRALRATSGVDEDVDLAESAERLRQHTLQRRSIGNVGRDTKCAPPKRFDLSCGRLDLFRAARSRHHIGACLGKYVSDGAPDTGSSTYDNGDLAVEFEFG